MRKMATRKTSLSYKFEKYAPTAGFIVFIVFIIAELAR